MQKMIVTGRLGRDASVNEGKNGNFLSFRIASNHRRNGVEKTSWFDVLVFNYEGRFKNMAKYLTKGSAVIVTGDYDDDNEEYNGEHRIRRTIIADSIEFNSDGGSKKEGEGDTKESAPAARKQKRDIEDVEDEPVVTATKRPRKTTAAPVEEDTPEPVEEGEGNDDDLPF